MQHRRALGWAPEGSAAQPAVLPGASHRPLWALVPFSVRGRVSVCDFQTEGGDYRRKPQTEAPGINQRREFLLCLKRVSGLGPAPPPTPSLEAVQNPGGKPCTQHRSPAHVFTRHCINTQHYTAGCLWTPIYDKSIKIHM